MRDGIDSAPQLYLNLSTASAIPTRLPSSVRRKHGPLEIPKSAGTIAGAHQGCGLRDGKGRPLLRRPTWFPESNGRMDFAECHQRGWLYRTNRAATAR